VDSRILTDNPQSIQYYENPVGKMNKFKGVSVLFFLAFALFDACSPVRPSPAEGATAAAPVLLRRTPTPSPSRTQTPSVTITPSLSPTPTVPAYHYLTLPGTDRLREIYRAGQQSGIRSGIFSKIGDSITANKVFLVPFGEGKYDLGEYGYLLDVVLYFSRDPARSGNSFANDSLAAKSGWRAEHVLDPSKAGSVCGAGEAPLTCEYRIVRPSIAVILLGTNDAMAPTGTFRISMRGIVLYSLNHGVIPILSTIPTMEGKDVEPFNAEIRGLAEEWNIPWIDLNSALASLPHRGLAPDGIHLSWIDPAEFRPPNFSFGMTVRNLLTLQALDAVWRSLPPEEG
jgi:hypothetical protein